MLQMQSISYCEMPFSIEELTSEPANVTKIDHGLMMMIFYSLEQIIVI